MPDIGKFTCNKFLHFLNIFFVLTKFSQFKSDKSAAIIFSHSENISSQFTTLFLNLNFIKKIPLLKK